MSRTQAKQLLITLGIEAPTEDQITSYLNSVGTEVQNEKAKLAVDQAEVARLKEVETQFTNLTAQNQTAEQKLQAALDAAELARKDFTKKTNRLEVEKVLVGAGLTEDDYKDLIDSMVSENAEASLKLANGFTGILKSKKDSQEKVFKEEALKNMPNPNGGAPASNQPKTDGEKLVETIAKTSKLTNDFAQSTLNHYTGGSK